MNDPLAIHTRQGELIAGLCQTVIPPQIFESVSLILHDEIDWDRTIGIARRNAVLPLLSWNLLNHFPDRLPGSVKQSLEQEQQRHLQYNMFQTAKLVELIRLFRDNDIEALPFKGPMLAIQAYGNSGLRKYGDLDVLVKPRQFKKAVELLENNGYTPLNSVGWLVRKDWYISRQKDVYFVDKSGTVKLELHWKLSGSHFGLPKEMNRLWERLETLDLGGTAIPALSFNDLLIYLCLHGSRHSWERLAWICDVNELIRSREGIDWDTIARDARRVGCENVVTLGLRLIHDLFGFEIPRSSISGSMTDKAYDRIVNEIRDGVFSDTSKQIEIGERYAYHLKLKERYSDRLKLHYHYLSWYLRLLLTPNELDHDMLHFPYYLTPLYYITRPIRLTYSFVMSKLSTQKD